MREEQSLGDSAAEGSTAAATLRARRSLFSALALKRSPDIVVADAARSGVPTRRRVRPPTGRRRRPRGIQPSQLRCGRAGDARRNIGRIRTVY